VSIDAAPQNAEIYQIIETWEGELALCSFTGLVFGMINGKSEFETSHVYFADRVISQIIQTAPGNFLAAEYSKPGYLVVDRHASAANQTSSQILDKRDAHICCCTDMAVPEMFNM